MLVDEAMETCFIQDKHTAGDGYGGVITTYADGAEISAAFSFDMSTEARVASVQGADDNFTITTRKNVVLRYGDIIRRVGNDKKYFITTNGDDNKTPASASLDMRVVRAKEWHG